MNCFTRDIVAGMLEESRLEREQKEARERLLKIAAEVARWNAWAGAAEVHPGLKAAVGKLKQVVEEITGKEIAEYS